MIRIIFTFLILAFAIALTAQTRISGKVSDGLSGESIFYANVLENNTTNLTETDSEGLFEITVSDTASITISYLGYESYVFKVVPGQTFYNIAIKEDAVQLNQVVVTAFGIEKDKKAAGFSFSEVGGEDLNQARELSVANQLVGKVAGLDITKPSNGPAGSTRIVLRGLAQFGGDNSPLIVLDGIILENSNISSAGLFGGRDSGDGLSALNSEDIENITVLKGLSATALYGARGGNGALIITSKSGKKQKGIGIEYTSNFVTEQVFLLPNYQQEYGQGEAGEKPTTQQEAFDNWRSWGARLDGSDTPIFNGNSIPYSPVGQDDIRSFYETGQTWTNGLSFNAGNKKIVSRTSLIHTSNKGIVQDARYRKYGLKTNISYKPIEKLTLSGKLNLIKEEAQNRTNLTDTPSNPAKFFTISPANLPQEILSQTRDEDENPINWSNNPFTLGPYWAINENPNEDIKNRIIASGSIKYEILDWLSAEAKASTDQYRHDFLNTEIDGTQHNQEGTVFLDTFNIKESNFDFLLSADRPLNERLDLQVNLGATRNDRYSFSRGTNGSQFIEPRIATIENSAVVEVKRRIETLQRINGLFANATLGINNYLYLEGSIRNDFFSVLTDPTRSDASENSILYGAGSLSFILSDAIKAPKWLSFAKLRLGYGIAGLAQIDPYSQVATYIISTDPKDSNGTTIPIASISGDAAINPFLRPSFTTAIEIGADLRVFENRVRVDINYYDQRTEDHILNNPLPASTGFNGFRINAGEIRNNGVELLVDITPIRNASFTWNTSFNFTKNNNTVLRLNDGLDQIIGEQDRSFSANIISRVGERVGDIWGNVYARNEAGQIIHDIDGIPEIAEERQILGNFNPDWFGGLTNTLKYKEFSFAFQIDAKQGGEILSTTSSFGYLFGKHINTLPGRDSDDFTIIGQGVGPDGETINDSPANLRDYYERISVIAEENVYDASYIKLRQVTLGYDFNKRVIEKLKFVQGIQLSLVGRNLLFLQNGLDELGLDPEAIYSNVGTNVGYEYAALPSTRSFGFNLKVKF